VSQQCVTLGLDDVARGLDVLGRTRVAVSTYKADDIQPGFKQNRTTNLSKTIDGVIVVL